MGMQGWRRTMEDSHIAHTDLDNGVSLFGVFDGHGGEFSHSVICVVSFLTPVFKLKCRTLLLNRPGSCSMGQGKLQEGVGKALELQEQVLQRGLRRVLPQNGHHDVDPSRVT